MASQFDQYKPAHEEALAKVLQLMDGAAWKKSKEEPGITFYTAPAEGSSYTMVKSVVEIKAPIENIIARVLKTATVEPTAPKEVMEKEGCRERRLINTQDDEEKNTFMYINLLSASRLVSERDFLMYRRLYNKDGKYISLNVSIVNDDIMPEQKGRVRAHMHFQAFIMEQINPETVRLTFMCHADPKGSVPAMVYNSAAVGQGYSAKKILDEFTQ